MSSFKEITLFKNLIDREPLKCQNLVEKLKNAFDKQKVNHVFLIFV
jgi:hypothetical protein